MRHALNLVTQVKFDLARRKARVTLARFLAVYVRVSNMKNATVDVMNKLHKISLRGK